MAPRSPTGIEGLDDVLGGGLPQHRLYLLQGHPGVGKTTLALQYLLEGAKRGERALYITLSENEEELRQVAASHGWSLDGVSVFEFKPSAMLGDDGANYTIFHPSEVELGEAMATLLAEVERVDPARVVFDSLSEIRLLTQHPLRYRRQILALKQHFAGARRTVLLLDDLTSDPGDGQLQSLVHGVISLERHSPEFGAERRRLQVAKLRGARFRSGYHDFAVETGGLKVFPRVIAAEHGETFTPSTVASGVSALDAMLGGGLDRGTSTLIMGPAGAGKTTIAAQYVAAAAARGERAAVFLFDESITTYLARSDALQTGLRKQVEAGRVDVRQIDPVELSPGEFTNIVRGFVEREGARMVVIDSLNGYLHAMTDEFAVMQLHELLAYLGRKGITTLLIAAQHGLLGSSMSSPIDVSYLADAVVLLRYFEAAGRVRNAISVVKKRARNHERTIREFSLGLDGLRVGAPLEAFHGVLTGVPTYTGAAEPLLPGHDKSAR